MGGLIPLLLPSTSGSRSSVIGISETRRPASTMFISATRTMGHRRQQSLPTIKPVKRLSAPVLPPLSVLPYTSAEWKKAINEIKQKYISRKYRTCSARCCEILDNLKDTSNVETLHLVYLHFYAASSSEMCARPLSQSSTYRTKLLKDAREHYDSAAALIQKAEDAATQKTRSASSNSTTSSIHSPSMSASSRCSTMGSPLSSPRNSVSSVSSIEDLKVVAQPSKPKKKKKVSFSGLPDSIEILEIPENNWQPEPYIRPDSPTLGWEEDYFLFGQQEMAVEPVKSAPEVVEPAPEPAKTVEQQSSTPTIEHHQFSPLLTSVPEEDKSQDLFDLDIFLQTRSMNRFCAQLSALRSQVSWHRDAVDTLLAMPEEEPDVPTIPDMPPIPELPALAHSISNSTTSAGSSVSDPQSPLTPLPASVSPRILESALSQRLMDSFGNASSLDLSSHPITTTDNLSEPWDRSLTGSVCSTFTSHSRSASSLSNSSRVGDEALQKRIERLRASGWQRKRFDNRRYEALREQVLDELRV
jgi:hypothetical protein